MNRETSQKRLTNLRHVGVAEGISFLVLLFIAMPLKYLLDLPEAVKVTGWLHGFLFIWYIIALLLVQLSFRWSFVKLTMAFVASLVPFGTFILDRRLRKEERIIFKK